MKTAINLAAALAGVAEEHHGRWFCLGDSRLGGRSIVQHLEGWHQDEIASVLSGLLVCGAWLCLRDGQLGNRSAVCVLPGWRQDEINSVFVWRVEAQDFPSGKRIHRVQARGIRLAV